MKLFQAGITPNCRRVSIFLAEKNITIPTVEIDLGKGEHMQPGFGEINPMRQVPSLQLDNGVFLTESIAICRYLEELNPEPPLFGTTPLQRAMTEMWQRRAEFGLLYPVMYVFRHTHPAMAKMEKPQVPAWAEANRPKVAAALELIDNQLKHNRFVAGDAYSVADITVQAATGFMRPARLAIPEELEHLHRWLRDVSGRPSAKA